MSTPTPPAHQAAQQDTPHNTRPRTPQDAPQAAQQKVNLNEQPLVSVLIPVYNVERHLAQCLESVCAQTYHNLEIICINDGSTDSSLQILRSFATRDERIHIIDKPNTGYGDSMNCGLRAAHGKYIGIVESDDFIDAGMYEAYVTAAERSRADLVKSDYYQYWYNREAYYDTHAHTHARTHARTNTSASADTHTTPRANESQSMPTNEKTCLFKLAGLPTDTAFCPRTASESFTLGPSIWSALYNRAFLECNNITFATTPGAAFQDTSFSHMVLICAKRAVFLNGAWLHYRIDSANSSSNSPDKVFLVFDEFDRSLAFLRSLPLWETAEGKRIGAALGAARMASCMWSYNRIAPRFKLQFALRWRDDLFVLNHEKFIDFALLRADSRELLELLAEDPLGFILRCDAHPDWFYYAYQPAGDNRNARLESNTLIGVATEGAHALYQRARHTAGRALRFSLRTARNLTRTANENGTPTRKAETLPTTLTISFVGCAPLNEDVMWRVAVTSPDCDTPIELRIFDGSGHDLAAQPILFEDQLIKHPPNPSTTASTTASVSAHTHQDKPTCARRVTYSLRLPNTVASFGITAKQAEAVYNFYLDEATVTRQIITMSTLRRTADDQDSFDRWLLAHPTRPADRNSQPHFPLEINSTHVALATPRVLIDPDCLDEISAALHAHPQAAALYTDHDHISADGRRTHPRFKPGFSPDFLRATNYVGDFLVVRKDLLDPTCDLWEQALRAAEVALQTEAAFIHIPRILWHKLANEDASDISAPHPTISPHAQAPASQPLAHSLRHLLDDATNQPRIDIIIPSKDHADVLESCISSILERATYQNYIITVIENGSTDPETFALYERLCARDTRIRIIYFEDDEQTRAPREFNYSRLINFGAAHTNAPYMLLLNNDTQIITPDFMQLLLEPLMHPRRGVTSGKLLFRDELVQHVGMLIGPDNTIVQATQDVEVDCPGYMGRSILMSNVSAVTGACQMVSRETFEHAGGYTEELAVGFNDADFCCKVRALGKFITVVPDALLYHFEFTSRGREATDASKIARWQHEHDLFQSRWPQIFEEGDPFANPNLNPNSKAFGL